jgi:hypothetical protein
MENKGYIRELLDKYLEGTTSLEEEKILKEYFNRSEIPRELKAEAEWFEHASRQHVSNEEVRSLETWMTQWVENQEHNTRKIHLRTWTMGIAAGLIILAGTAFFLQHYRASKTGDTYQDPQMAYLEARKVLLYVSQTLNKGTDKLQTVSRFQDGTNEMSMFSTFGSGLKNLELVTKYNDSNQTQ